MIKHFFLVFVVLITLLSCKSKPLLQFNLDDVQNKETIELLTYDAINIDANNGLDNSNGIKVSYVGNARGSKGLAKHILLKESIKEATLNYSVKFDKDFQFKKGGKLLGLAPIKVINSGKKSKPDGWSVRVMFKPDGKTGSYIYHQNREGKFGDTEISKSPVFVKGKYSNVSLYIKINEPAQAHNGVCEVWVDGELIIKRSDIQYRSVDGKHTLINKFILSTFHGGASPGYAPKDENGNFTIVHAWFDNIEIHEGKHITLANKKKSIIN